MNPLSSLSMAALVARQSLFWLFLIATCASVCLVASPALAQDDTAEETMDEPMEAETEVVEETETETEEEASDEDASDDEATPSTPATEFEITEYTINTLIMFICAVLVIFMQAGFAMVEAGLNAAKNTVNILFKNLMDLCVGVLLFWVIGYALMYPGGDSGGKWFGWSGSIGVSREFAEVDEPGSEDIPRVDGTVYVSNSVDFFFQVAFAATAATIVSGAVAGRMQFAAYLVYSAVLTGFIYPISGMWKWGGGYLAEAGFADFAGSVVVHGVGGFAGLAGAIVLGPRIGRFVNGKSIPMPGHNLTFAALGVLILWVGWYGFNPGSMLMYTGLTAAEGTVYIALTTTLAAAAGGVVATLVGWIAFRKPDLTMGLNGVLAGLVGITANCDQVTQIEGIIIGGVAGVLVVGGILLLDILKIDDPVGAFPVHGLCGVWGGIATGIFGDSMPTVGDVELSRAAYIWVQCYSTVIICAWAFVTMFIVFFLMKLIGILRVTPEEEVDGLDIGEHGMLAYPPQWVVDTYPGGK